MASKRRPKIIADAERHRRTPRTLAVESKALESKKSADIGCTGAEKGEKNMRKPSKYDQNGSQNRSEINEKSRLRRGCVFGAFLGSPGAPNALRPGCFWEPFGNHFRPKLLKNEKKMNTAIGHCPGALQERKKNDFCMQFCMTVFDVYAKSSPKESQI